jgi:Protein of unknown function (DUF3102)
MHTKDSPPAGGTGSNPCQPQELIDTDPNLAANPTVATNPDYEPLAESAKTEINRLHGEICEAARTSIGKAIRIGELLTQVRSTLKHGEWLPWLKENVGFSRQTADNYRRIYEKREDIKLLNVGNLSEAYRALANPQNEPEKDSVDEYELVQFRLWKLKRRLDAVCAIPVEHGTPEHIRELQSIIEDANTQGQWWRECQLRAEKKFGEALISARPVASAIAEIRDRRLYRETYSSFAEYCEMKLGMSESRINELVSIILV